MGRPAFLLSKLLAEDWKVRDPADFLLSRIKSICPYCYHTEFNVYGISTGIIHRGHFIDLGKNFAAFPRILVDLTVQHSSCMSDKLQSPDPWVAVIDRYLADLPLRVR